MTRRHPIITDHAMLRYLERVIGVDVARHRHDIEQRVAMAVNLGACALVSDGHRYAIQDCHIVTVKPVRSDPLRVAEYRENREAHDDDI